MNPPFKGNTMYFYLIKSIVFVKIYIKRLILLQAYTKHTESEKEKYRKRKGERETLRDRETETDGHTFD